MLRTLLGLLVVLAACGPAPQRSPSTTPAPPTTAVAPPSESQARFVAAAAKMGVTYQAPAGYSEVPVKQNLDVAYDYAIQSANRRIEMRFALRPYQADAPEPTRTLDFSWTFFLTGIANLTHGGQSGDHAPPEPVPAEDFAADDARIVVVRWFASNDVADYFGHGYELCAAIFVHREGVGDIYTFVLFKDRDATGGMDEATMHTLKFAAK